MVTNAASPDPERRAQSVMSRLRGTSAQLWIRAHAFDQLSQTRWHLFGRQMDRPAMTG